MSSPPATPPDDHRLRLLALRDAYRSARRWRDLLSDADRAALLSDIARVALAVGRDLTPDRDLSDLDIGDGKGGDVCPRERLAFLEAGWPRLVLALRQIEAAPCVRLEAETRLVLAERARRITPRAVLEAVRTGDFVPASSQSSPLAARLNGRLPRRFREQTLAPTSDTPPNRAVKTILVHWVRDLQAIADLARVVGDAEAARRAEGLRVRVRARLRGEPWRNLAPLPAVPPLAPSLRTSGPYRIVHDAYRRFRRGFAFDWDNPIFTLPSRETWRLYEYWCFFAVADALRALGFRVASADDFTIGRGGLQWTLATGRASRLRFISADGRQVALFYNRSFERADGEETNAATDRDGLYSRSHALRPDITLETTDKNGGPSRLWVFDAKFKTFAENGWETDDIRQMHSYRDAIRRRGQDGAVVRGAWLLYAGRAAGEAANRPVIAYPQATRARPWGNGDVGAVCLRPGATPHETLTALVAAALANESL